VLDSVDVTYDVLWRSTAGDVKVAEITHHFVSPSGSAQFDAVPFDGDVAGIVAAARPGDQLVLRISAAGTNTQSVLFIPNGDGANAHGRIPSLTLP
jgi:hypothetical protein